MGPIFLAESQSRLYQHMRAKFGRDPTAVSKKVAFNFISRLMHIDEYYVNTQGTVRLSGIGLRIFFQYVTIL